MKFSGTLLSLLSLAVTSVIAVPSPAPAGGPSTNAFDVNTLSRGNHFGAPKGPGQQGAKPGWYYGKHPHQHPKLPCLSGVSAISAFLFLLLVRLYGERRD